ncbi:MAG: hypothetical protein J2P59_04155, partial [Acidimicrobiales bacterium]|nr:hypothetical protein [Acidimicrobiales bacterium]
MRSARALVVVGAVVLALGASAFGGVSGKAQAASLGSQAPHKGGTMTVLENSGGIGNWPSLDPGLDPQAAAEDDAYFQAIYGDLFQLNGKSQIVPDLATSYAFSNGGKTVTINLRHGVSFTDGTPFNAAAVQYNIQRDLNPANACACIPFFPVSSVTTSGNYTVVLNLSRPFSPIISSFPEEPPNWIESPTAIA